MPIGTSVAQTDQIRRQLEAAAMKTVTELEKGRPGQPGILENVYSVVGGTIAEAGPGMVTAATGSHLAETVLLLTESEIRGVPAAQVAALWRRHVGEIRGAEALTFTATLMRMGANIDLEISHGDPGILLQAARRLKEALNTYPGVTDIADSHAPGKKELKLRLRPEAGRLGITEEDLALQVRAAFFGMEAFRIQREREEIKVMVRYPQEERQHPEDWRHLRVRGKEGLEMALEQAALVEEGRGYSIIKRSERKRVINVTATVEATGQTGEILADLQRTILADLSRDYPGFKYRFAGEEKERQDSMVSMGRGLLVALFVIYALLAIPLGNYSQPFIIMAVLPFGFIGALGGHLLWGYDIGMLSLFGIVAVCGVVVNNSLILIDYINRRLAEGATLLEASLDAGQRRFRPILCTSLTTFFGLVPMIAERSIQAQFLVPMAISLAYGVLLGMVISLLLTPALCLILEDAKSFVSRRR
jgi:multidrug efflux pump subunit AcrB